MASPADESQAVPASTPPALPPPLPIEYQSARPPIQLDYTNAAQPWRTDRFVMGVLSLVAGLIALGVLVGTIDIWIKTWPSFGMTLLAAPAGLVALAFGSIAVSAAKVAAGNDAP